jgi:exodeoxyribonuclease VII large subunit
MVRAAIEDSVGVVWVEGEVSNYRKQASGHQYFTLKDAQSQVACVWFARGGLRVKQVALSDGMQVQVRGAMTVYEARGQYQINVQIVQAGGAGLLQARFEALKRKLAAEGLFEAARKRALPKFPAAIGIVTSPTGAALRDMLNILARRAPWVRVVVSPVRVQGEGAAEEIAAAVAELNRVAVVGTKRVDVIVVARGGGSAEDLWEFNEEVVARAMVASEIPVVSAVGHEVDFTIADFVADLRAPTPSAAAELIVPDGAELLRMLSATSLRSQRRVGDALERCRSELDFLSRSALFREPRNRLAEAAQRTDLAAERLRLLTDGGIGESRRRIQELVAALRHHRPDQVLAMRRQEFSAARNRLADRLRQTMAERRAHLDRLSQVLRLLAPEATLSRGFSITTTTDGAVLKSVREIRPGMKLVTRLKDGTAQSTAED